MRHIIVVISVALATQVSGEERPWVAMSGVEITEALTGQTLKYATATQKFHASGKTLYDAGRPSWGYWRVVADQYCSQWPPNDLWTCYGMERRGEMLRFVRAGNDITQAEVLRD